MVDESSEERPGCLRGVRNLLLFLLVPVLAVVALLPTLMSSDGGRRWALAKINAAAAPAQVSFDRWSLGWFRAPTLESFAYTDEARGISVTAERAVFDRGLLRLLPVGFWDLGEITLEKPMAELSLATERTISSSKGAAAPETRDAFFLPVVDVAARLKFSGGRVAVSGDVGESFAAEQVEGGVTLASWRKPILVQARMNAGGGMLSAEGRVQSIRDFYSGAEGGDPEKVTLKLAGVDLAVFRLLFAHMTGHAWIRGGSADGSLTATIHGKTRGRIEADLAVARLAVEPPGQPPSPKGDVTLGADLDYDKGAVNITRFDIASPWLRAEAGGRLQAGQNAGVMTGAITAKATLFLTALARDFATPLGLSRDIRVNGGELRADVTVEGTDAALRVHTKAVTAGLSVTAGGEPLSLKPEPSLEFKAVFPHGGTLPELEAFHLKAPFADVYASGRFDSATVKARLNLTRFARDAKRVLKDCPPMVGEVYLDANSRRDGDAVAVASLLKLTDVAVELQPGQRTVVPQGALKAGFRVPLESGVPLAEAQDAVLELTLADGKAAASWTRLVPEAEGRPLLLSGFAFSCDMDTAATRRLLGGITTPAAQRRLAALRGRVIANATAEAAAGTVKSRFNARTDLFDIDAEADVSGPQTRRAVTAKGNAAIDFKTVTRLLEAEGVTGFTLTGRESRPFRFSSPVAGGLPAVLAQGDLTAAAHIATCTGLGLNAGPADAALRLSKGALRIAYEPPLNGGRLRFVPGIAPAGEDGIALAFPAGTRLLENVTLTQGMMDSLIVQMNPLFQGSKVLGGTVTLDLRSFRAAPSRRPGEGVTADMDILFKDLKLDLGPPLRELLDMIKVRERVYTVAQLPAHVTMREGRIHVDPVTMVIERQPVIFGGWCGFDGTVRYQVEVPVTERLVGAIPYKVLKGTSVKIPVAGTVEEPRLDTARLRSMLSDMLKGAVPDQTIKRAGDFLEQLQRELTR